MDDVKHVLFERLTKGKNSLKFAFESAVRMVNIKSKTIWDESYFLATVSKDGILFEDSSGDTCFWITKDQVDHMKTILSFFEKRFVEGVENEE